MLALSSTRLEITPRGVASITLNAPARGNPLGQAIVNDLLTLIPALDADPAVRLLILKGEGKHFCSGADLTTDLGDAEAEPVRLNEMLEALNTVGKPTIALIHGACIGGGVALAACCDLVIAEENAFFSIPELRLGFPPRPMMPFFIQFMGQSLVRRYTLTGERLTAQDAFRLNLLYAIAPRNALQEAVDRAVDQLLLAAPEAVRRFRDMLAEHNPVAPQAFARARAAGDQMASVFRSAEPVEGFRAFLEKRKPHWYRPA